MIKPNKMAIAILLLGLLVFLTIKYETRIRAKAMGPLKEPVDKRVRKEINRVNLSL